jgi:hypothetical protein
MRSAPARRARQRQSRSRHAEKRRADRPGLVAVSARRRRSNRASARCTEVAVTARLQASKHGFTALCNSTEGLSVDIQSPGIAEPTIAGVARLLR